jgi:hypothetical protein
VIWRDEHGNAFAESRQLQMFDLELARALAALGNLEQAKALAIEVAPRAGGRHQGGGGTALGSTRRSCRSDAS